MIKILKSNKVKIYYNIAKTFYNMMSFIHKRLLITILLSLSFGNSSKVVSDLIESLLNDTIYNSKIRPLSDAGIPLDIYININVNEISSISEVQMEYSMTCYLRQSWKDERLAYQDYNKSITLNFNQFDRIWVPDVFIRNLKAGTLHTITVPNRLIRLSPDGTVLYSQRLSMTLVCDMMLDRYPMDNQTCYIEFGSYAYTTDDLIFHWRINQLPVELNPDISLPEYVITGITSIVCTTDYNSTGTFPCLRANFLLSRRLKAYMLTTYLPSFLVVLLSWLSFWIDPESTPARTSLSILTILTVTTQSSSLMRSTPAGSFTKASDVWMATCLVFVFAAFIEYSIVNTLSRRKKKKNQSSNTVEPAKIQNPASDKSPNDTNENNTIKNNIFGNGNSNNGSSNNKDNNANITSTLSRLTKMKEYLCYHYTDEPAVFVELISRIIFPILFLFFNLVYWSVYLTGYTFKGK